ncbi:helix-turn-helix domain-containing protein [Thiohalorhabdus sp. Cl-TMA]|uniref:Helix-turn-helix domain-containing protein n=1 Tax=Thiohalorhabdus methylotrophus TaxID=3242694 RepID=A0ABV4TUI9_9GAMM
MKENLSPKEVAEAIDVSESSVKRWVDGGRLEAFRTAGGHRRILQEEALRFARSEGFRLVRPDLLGLPEAPVEDAGAEEPEESFHRALMSGREAEASGLLVGRYMDGQPLPHILDTLISPSLRRIGELWRETEEGIFIEHRAADICERALDQFRELAPPLPDDAPVAVGGSSARDAHSLPSRMAATVLHEQGWRVVNLGAFTPPSTLRHAVSENGARLAWVAVTLLEPGNQIRRLVADYHAALQEESTPVSLAVGGPFFRGADISGLSGAQLVTSMGELAAFAQGLHARNDPDGPGPAHEESTG